MGILIKGKPVADKIKEKLKKEVAESRKRALPQSLPLSGWEMTPATWHTNAGPLRQW